ncbi:MAG: YjbQ family protein [Magnetococcales bacterium]|nr:YjbQ family protein [Magnetococcales bacterium]
MSQQSLRQAQTTFSVTTRGQGLYELTSEISHWLQREKAGLGMVTLFCRHTSASLTIQENADPDVLNDLNTFCKKLVPEDTPWFRHTCEGSDDMPAHIRTALTDVSLSIPVDQGRLALGTWQGIFLFEHRRTPHQRQVVAHYCGV